MTNEFKRTPTHGENDVDLRVATEPRRVTDAVLSQIIATKDGEIAALTAEVTHLAEKLAERDVKVDRDSVLEEIAIWYVKEGCLLEEDELDVPTAIRALKSAPQPVDAAQAVPEGFDLDALANACIECDIPDSTYESLCIALKAAQPTDTTKGL